MSLLGRICTGLVQLCGSLVIAELLEHAKRRVADGSCVTSSAGPYGERNCTRDGGVPFGFGNQVLISSHRKLLSSKAMVVNVADRDGIRKTPPRHADKSEKPVAAARLARRQFGKRPELHSCGGAVARARTSPERSLVVRLPGRGIT
jgi:hypothetical protein